MAAAQTRDVDKRHNEVGGRRDLEQQIRAHVNTCYPQHLIVHPERPEDFVALQSWWISHYDGEAARPLLQEAVANEWLLKRAQRNQVAVEAWLAETNPNEWSDQQLRRLQLILRLKAAAERSFHRSLAAIERFRHWRLFESLAQRRAQAQWAEQARQRREAEEEDTPPEETLLDIMLALPDLPRVPALQQWVDVTQDGDTTVTTLTPSDEELLALAEKMDPKPQRVHRMLRVWPWLATEYIWAKNLPGTTEVREQVMTLDEWRRAREREKAFPGGHVGPVEQDPTWVDEWKKQKRDGEKTIDEKERATENTNQKPGFDEKRQASDPGAVGRGPHPQRPDHN